MARLLIAHPKHDLLPVEGLGQEVVGAQVQRVVARNLTHVAGQHKHG